MSFWTRNVPPRRYCVRGNGTVKAAAIYASGGRNSVYSSRALQNSHCSRALLKVRRGKLGTALNSTSRHVKSGR